jgi:NAD(P)-dependent dehydrogenase (short-subunit alcohol dehydrogenase family)
MPALERVDWIAARRAGTLSAMSESHVAIVTGAGRGIGAAIALRLAREGVAVLVAARTQSACAEVVASIRASNGMAWPVELDVGDAASIERAIARARELARERGPIDWLVNNAGIAETAPIVDRDRKRGADLYERHLAINFHGPRRMIEALAPDMIERGYGRIVNMGSSASLQGYPYASAYVASKHALLGYSRSAALELARTGVAVNIVCPHYVDSPMTDATVARIVSKTQRDADDTRRFLAGQNPGGTLITVDEVAEMTWHLLSSDESGAVVELLGGAGVRPAAETVRWRERGVSAIRSGAR